MEKIVYIVHCIDTEGPLYESLEATFERVKDAFGVDIEPTKVNLKKLQNEKIPLDGREKAIAKMVSKKNLDYNDTWDKIDDMLNYVTSEEFRKKIPDSFGNGWIFNWFCLDHVGFNGQNPRRRDIGFHNIFDHYNNYMKRNNIDQDMIQWHFHPVPLIKDAHRSGTNYLSSSIIFEILARKIIDRSWFPAAFRPGFHTERPDSNWFLEQWIPFDYANQSMKNETNDQPDLSEGRFGDWRKAPIEWKVYHPNHDNYQKEGNCRRWIARCLNMKTRFKNIKTENIRKGFKRAQSGKPTLISFTNHDFRDMEFSINRVRDKIKKVSEDFPDVKFKYTNAIEGIREVIGVNKNDIEPPNFQLKIEEDERSAHLSIKSKNDIFGPQPFFAIKTKSNEYYWHNLDFQRKNHWSFTFDFHTLPLEAIEKIGIAANTKEGLTEVIVMDPSDGEVNKTILNED